MSTPELPATLYPCPFVYANQRACPGHVVRFKAYGPRRGPPRKLRFWCSEKGDHAGVVPSMGGKQRMEFYPDQVPEHLGWIVERAFNGETGGYID